MSLQPILFIGLLLAALLYAGAGLIYLRKGMRTKRRWYGLITSVLLYLPLLGFLGVVFGSQGQWVMATIGVIAGISTIVSATRWRPPAAQGTQS